MRSDDLVNEYMRQSENSMPVGSRDGKPDYVENGLPWERDLICILYDYSRTGVRSTFGSTPRVMDRLIWLLAGNTWAEMLADDFCSSTTLRLQRC
jgi:hypothetical protein